MSNLKLSMITLCLAVLWGCNNDEAERNKSRINAAEKEVRDLKEKAEELERQNQNLESNLSDLKDNQDFQSSNSFQDRESRREGFTMEEMNEFYGGTEVGKIKEINYLCNILLIENESGVTAAQFFSNSTDYRPGDEIRGALSSINRGRFMIGKYFIRELRILEVNLQESYEYSKYTRKSCDY